MKSLITVSRVVATTLAVTAVAALGACSPTPGVDFWGNPEPTPEPACGMPILNEPLPTREADTGTLDAKGRPIDTPIGWGWMVFYLHVAGLAREDGVTDNRFCLPVDIHVFGRAAEVDLVMLNPVGIPVGPEAFAATTPWYGRFAIQYDPTDPRFAGRPPNYEIHLDVAYTPERDIFVTPDPTGNAAATAIGVGCKIATDVTQGWKNAATVAHDFGVFPVKNVATCVFHGNKFNYS